LSNFHISLGLESSLALFLALRNSEGKLETETVLLERELLSYLYEHLSIEDMENPERLYKSLVVKTKQSQCKQRKEGACE